jgi:hypothetical protein
MPSGSAGRARVERDVLSTRLAQRVLESSAAQRRAHTARDSSEGLPSRLSSRRRLPHAVPAARGCAGHSAPAMRASSQRGLFSERQRSNEIAPTLCQGRYLALTWRRVGAPRRRKAFELHVDTRDEHAQTRAGGIEPVPFFMTHFDPSAHRERCGSSEAPPFRRADRAHARVALRRADHHECRVVRIARRVKATAGLLAP